MFAYYLQLGLRSLRKNPLLTLLMVLAIGCGVAASMTTYSVFRATSNNPIPQKSSQLFVPQIDNWGPDASQDNKGEPPNAMTYTDAINLMRDKRATRQTALFPAAVSIVPADPQMLPFRETSYAWYADAFAMFDIPFLYGHGWTADEDASHAAVAVIGKKLNEKLFNGANSVGRNINLNGRDYRIVGVANTWNPEPVFYDVINTNGFDDPIEVFMPFTRAVELQTTTNGNNNCSKDPGKGWDAWIGSECRSDGDPRCRFHPGAGSRPLPVEVSALDYAPHFLEWRIRDSEVVGQLSDHLIKPLLVHLFLYSLNTANASLSCALAAESLLLHVPSGTPRSSAISA